MLANTMKEALLYKKYNPYYDWTISKYDINDFMVTQQTLEELKEEYNDEVMRKKQIMKEQKKKDKELEKYRKSEQKRHLKKVRESQRKGDNIEHPEIDWGRISIEIYNKTYGK